MRSFADDREIQANSDRFLLSDFTYLSPNRAKISLKKSQSYITAMTYHQEISRPCHCIALAAARLGSHLQIPP